MAIEIPMLPEIQARYDWLWTAVARFGSPSVHPVGYSWTTHPQALCRVQTWDWHGEDGLSHGLRFEDYGGRVRTVIWRTGSRLFPRDDSLVRLELESATIPDSERIRKLFEVVWGPAGAPLHCTDCHTGSCWHTGGCPECAGPEEG